jgi:DNA repair protein RecO (recombination protein O)
MWAAALVDSVEKVTEEREESFQVYGLLLAGLAALGQGKGASVVPAFLIKLLSLSGFHPSLRVCAGCGTTSGLEGFSVSLGGAVCGSCWRGDPGAVRLSPARIALLGELLSSDFGAPAGDDDLGELNVVLRRYAEFHLERPLRSMHLLQTI